MTIEPPISLRLPTETVLLGYDIDASGDESQALDHHRADRSSTTLLLPSDY